jgi:lysozyme
MVFPARIIVKPRPTPPPPRVAASAPKVLLFQPPSTGSDGVALITRFEGFSRHIYLCPAGYPTIGYGHVVLEHEKERFLDGVDELEALDLLQADLPRFEASVKRLVQVSLTQRQFDALVSFCYNLGGGALQRSTLRQKLNRGEYEEAAEEFGKWVFAGGRKLKGLVIRRAFERALFLS